MGSSVQNQDLLKKLIVGARQTAELIRALAFVESWSWGPVLEDS